MAGNTLQFDDDGKLIVSEGGGPGVATDVNLKEVAGNPIGDNNPVPVKLTNGTDPVGTDANPLRTSPATTAANQPVTAPGGGALGLDSTLGTIVTALASIFARLLGVVLAAGNAIIGKVGIDQTTPGTTNAVQVIGTLPAGTAIIGKIGIDQTTPGTTNGVQVVVALPAGAAVIGKVSIDQTTPGTTNAVQLTAGAAIVGKVGIDQTTPGTTNATANADVVSAANSSVTPLAANGVFNAAGAWESSLGYQALSITVLANVASATSGLSIQQSGDGANADTTEPYTIAANTNARLIIPITHSFFRVIYTNGGTIQATFRLQTIKKVDTCSVWGTLQDGLQMPSPLNLNPLMIGALDAGSGNLVRSCRMANGNTNLALVVTPCAQNTYVDGQANASGSAGGGGATQAQVVAMCASVGAAAQTMIRTPNVFKTVSVPATPAGNTVAWTPAANRRFRLMRFSITAQGLAATVAAVVTVSFQDAAVGITIGTYEILVPAVAALQNGIQQVTGGWVDLGNGFASAAINQALNVNISAAGAGTLGTYRVNVCGTEEL